MNHIHPCSVIYRDVVIESSVVGQGVSIGDFSKVSGSMLSPCVRIDRYNHIDFSCIGQYSYTGRNTIIIKSNIGAFTSISWNVTIGGANHDYERMSQHSFLYDRTLGLIPESSEPAYDRYQFPVNIGSDVWIAAGAVITRGVSIGSGAIVGANSVVTKDVPPYAIVAGVPARIIKYRFDKKTIESMLKLQWWRWPPEKIRENFSLLSGKPMSNELLENFLND